MSAESKSIFATRLYELRIKNNLTQQKLASLVGVTQQSIWKWETDRSEPNIEKLRRLAELFGVPTDTLLGLTDILPDENAPDHPNKMYTRSTRGRKSLSEEIMSGSSVLVYGNELENAVRDILKRILVEDVQKAAEA